MNRPSIVAACIAHVALSASAARAVVYNMPPDALPTTLFAGDTLNFNQGGVIPQFASLEARAGSTVNLYGGSMGDFTNLSGNLNIYGGKNLTLRQPMALRLTFSPAPPATST